MLKKTYILIFFIAAVFILTGFLSKKDKPYYKTFSLPGTVQVDSNLFADQNEVTNFMWLEYMFWTGEIFGKKSETYKAILPDTNIWLKNPYHVPFMEFYMDHPAYRNYPTVVITQEQAIKYCKWRSDRVFEFILIKEGVLDHNPNQDSNNYFTIGNYFSGKYNNNQPSRKYHVYPNYKLPSYQEWQISQKFYSKYNEQKLKKLKPKYCQELLEYDSLMWICDFTFERLNTENSERFISPANCYKSNNIGFHFYGNVSEWLSEENTIIGGNWEDTITSHFNIPITAKEAATTIGFRAVCEWKEYKVDN